MKNINISEDIIPIGQFKSGISKYLKSVQATGQPLVITQNGRPAGVLLSPAEYDALVYKQAFVASVQNGIADAEAGKLYETDEVRARLEKNRAGRK